MSYLGCLVAALRVKHTHVRQEDQRQHEHVAEHPHVHQLGVRGLRESAADLWTAVVSVDTVVVPVVVEVTQAAVVIVIQNYL